MTALNKQALREAAEKATPGRVGDRIEGSGSIKYECHGYDGSLVLRTDHKNMEYGFIGDNGNADELFFRLCVPDVVLALLDELEAADELNKHLELAIRKAEGCSEALRRRAEAAENHLEKVRGYNVDLVEESRQYQQSIVEMDNALCDLLPGTQYMDPPDGGSVTPLEQVRRMVADYRERLKIAESLCDHRSKFWDVSGVQRCTLCDKAISSDGDQQVAELEAAGIITKVGE